MTQFTSSKLRFVLTWHENLKVMLISYRLIQFLPTETAGILAFSECSG